MSISKIFNWCKYRFRKLCVLVSILIIYVVVLSIGVSLENAIIKSTRSKIDERTRLNVEYSRGFSAGIRTTMKYIQINGTNVVIDLHDVLTDPAANYVEAN